MSKQTHFFRQTLSKSFQLFIPVAILRVSGATVVYKSELETVLNKIHPAETQSINLATHSVSRVVQEITNDLAYLAAQQELIKLNLKTNI